MVKIKNRKAKIALMTLGIILLIGAILTVIIVPLYFTNVSFSDPAEGFELPIVTLDEIGGSDALRFEVDRTDSYQTHPDMTIVDDGKALIVYTQGHGKGPIAMKELDFANGQIELSQRIENTPASWEKSQETGTLYTLQFVDGEGNKTDKTAIVLLSGCPRWPGTIIMKNGFNCSLSTDKGANWTEFQNFYGREWAKQNRNKTAFDCIVAMSSLTQLKENGKFVNKWMGTFHDHKFVNYKTYLTFEESANGGLEMRWTEPVPLLGQWRSTEKKTGMCEIEIIRTPSSDGAANGGDTLVLIARGEKRVSESMIAFSDDEGESWSCPKPLPLELSGDRHKAAYDEESGKLIISFRHVNPFAKRYSNLGAQKATTSLGWIGWVGSFDDLLSYRQNDSSKYRKGDMVLLFSQGYKNGADCGYSGTAVVNGNFIGVSYGTFDEYAQEPYILGVKIPIANILGKL